MQNTINIAAEFNSTDALEKFKNALAQQKNMKTMAQYIAKDYRENAHYAYAYAIKYCVWHDANALGYGREIFMFHDDSALIVCYDDDQYCEIASDATVAFMQAYVEARDMHDNARARLVDWVDR